MSKSISELFETLLKSNEIRKIDFKRDQYKFDTDHLKSKFVKDILCIANAPEGDGYIVLGVIAEKGNPKEINGILYHYDSANLEGIVNGVVEVPIQFEYHPIKYKGKECGIIHIPSSIGRPHWPKKDFGVLKKHVFYTRRASGNAEASIEEIRQMCMETIRISDIAKQKAKVTHHIIDELATLNMDERKSKMYDMLKSITHNIGLINYRSMVDSYYSSKETQFILANSFGDKGRNEYSIFMYPWSVKMQDIIRSRNNVKYFISPHRTNKLRSQEKERLKISKLIHIAYKNIYTNALENRQYGGLNFENEMNESWGKVIIWDEYSGIKEKYEFFIQNISSKEELKDRLEKLLAWVEININNKND